jgi:hypothetical protein
MKNIMSLVAVLGLLASGAALACSGSPPPNCSCVNNQWVVNNTVNNTTTNNVTNGINGGVNNNNTNDNKNTNTNSATGGTGIGIGVGGQGGQGGAGGSVKDSGNSTNTNNLGQAQLQGQQQSINNSGNSTIEKGAVTNNNTVSGGNASIAEGAVKNTNNNTSVAVGGNSNASIASGAVKNTVQSNSSVGNVGSTSSVGNVSTGASTSSATAEASGNGSGNGNGNSTDITYAAPKTYRAPVETAYSASLTSGFDTCLGSISGGAQTQILGLTLGGTKIDKNCILIKQTQLLREVNQSRAACFRMQMGKEGADIKQAMADAGAECPPLVVPVVVAPAPVVSDSVTHSELADVEKRITSHVLQK